MKKLSILLLATLLLTSTTAQAREITIGASIPVMAPLTGGVSYGVGVLPRLQLAITDHFKLHVEGGAILSAETGGWTAMEYPVLLGGTWEFGQPGDMGRPFIHVLAGYTRANDERPDIDSVNWLTLGAGSGVNIRWRDAIFQVGINIMAPDVRGSSRHPVWMAVNLGVHYALFK